MTREEPNEFTVLLKVVEVVGASLRNGSGNPPGSEVHAELINIINMLGNPVNQEINMRDRYTTGQAGAVGPSSQASNNTFDQAWGQQAQEIDLPALATELCLLRAEMKKQGSQPEDDFALAEVAHAEIAASAGDGVKVISHLSKAGKWALSVATSIGAGVAVEAIKAAMGI